MPYRTQSSFLLRGLLMASEIPVGDLAIFACVEMFALAFAFEGAAAIIHGEEWWKAVIAWPIAVCLFVAGLKWRWLKRILGERIATFVARYRLPLLVSLVLYLWINQSLYIFQLRADIDTYAFPRVIANSQAKTVRKVLAGSHERGLLTIVYRKGDQESLEYASQLASAIRAGGWKVETEELNPWSEEPQVNDKGIFDVRNLLLDDGITIYYGFVRQRNSNFHFNAGSEHALIAALDDAGIEIKGGHDDSLNKHECPLIIEVGRRPLTVRRHPRLMERAVQLIMFWDR
jgi:hypothetical protein